MADLAACSEAAARRDRFGADADARPSPRRAMPSEDGAGEVNDETAAAGAAVALLLRVARRDVGGRTVIANFRAVSLVLAADLKPNRSQTVCAAPGTPLKSTRASSASSRSGRQVANQCANASGSSDFTGLGGSASSFARSGANKAFHAVVSSSGIAAACRSTSSSSDAAFSMASLLKAGR